ncbi:MAG: NAD(+)/NADH kinase [Balneolaceae bacterium]
MKFALIAHSDKYTTTPPLKRVIKWCEKNDTTFTGTTSLFDSAGIRPETGRMATNSEKEAIEAADIAIVIGGDGTILRTAQLVQNTSVPLLGINCGRLGFMANIPEDRIEESLNAVRDGAYQIDSRSMLEASANNGKHFLALNEFLFTKKDTTSLITLTVNYGDHFVNRYWADGLIVSTPTGSTAYNLSSGGPIVMPGTPVMVVTPINPHTLTTRSLVLPSDQPLTVRIEEESDHALFSNDGKIMEIKKRPLEVVVRQSEKSVNLIQLQGQNYFDTLRTKLMWGMDTRK